MKGLEAIQIVLDWVGVSKDKTHDAQLTDLRKEIDGLKGGGTGAPDISTIRRERRREKNKLLNALVAAEKPAVQKLLEQEIADFDAETEELIVDAEAKSQKAAEAKAKAEAEAKERKEKMGSGRKIKIGVVLGILGILFLVVFTPVRFIDIFGGLALLGIAYGIYYWRWKK